MTDDELDAGFRDFFRSERPTPWPWDQPHTVASTRQPAHAQPRPVWTLAATVAIALMVGLTLTPSLNPPTRTELHTPSPLDGAVADGKKIVRDVLPPESLGGP